MLEVDKGGPTLAWLCEDGANPKRRGSKAGRGLSEQAMLWRDEVELKLVKSTTEGGRPIRDMPDTESAEPGLEELRTGRAGPGWPKSRTSTAGPRHAKLLGEGGEPDWEWSKTDNEESNSAAPKTKKLEPVRPKLRADGQLSRRRMLKIET